ncbi:Uncharacterized protein DAT39_015068, partial [Clarias magur]
DWGKDRDGCCLDSSVGVGGRAFIESALKRTVEGDWKSLSAITTAGPRSENPSVE